MKNAGKACNNRLYRHIRTFEKIVKNYFVISCYIANIPASNVPEMECHVQDTAQIIADSGVEAN